MDITSNSATEVLISRRYHARRELIFRAFTEPSLLARWFSPDPGVMTVRLTPDEDDTDLLVRHERLPDVGARDRHDIGWQATLDRLDELLHD